MLLGAGSLRTLPSEAGALTCPMHTDVTNSRRSSKGTASTMLGQPGCGNLSSRVDFDVPAGVKAVRFSKDTRCRVGRGEVVEGREGRGRMCRRFGSAQPYKVI